MATRRTLSLIWGAAKLTQQTAAAEAWYHELLESQGFRVEVFSGHVAATAVELKGAPPGQ